MFYLTKFTLHDKIIPENKKNKKQREKILQKHLLTRSNCVLGDLFRFTSPLATEHLCFIRQEKEVRLFGSAKGGETGEMSENLCLADETIFLFNLNS